MEHTPAFGEQDVAAAPDLLAVFADQEVTVFGVTGTFQTLAAMCPKDFSIGEVDQEAINTFVVKVANEASLAIDATYEPYFSKVLEREGVAAKFTLAENLTPRVAIQPEQVAQTVEKQVQTAVQRPAMEAIQPILLRTPVTEQVPKIMIERERQAQAVKQVIDSLVVERIVLADVPQPERATRLSSEDTSLAVKAFTTQATEKSQENSMTADGPRQTLVVLHEVELTPPTYEAPSITVQPEAARNEITALTEELKKEPLELFQDFTAALLGVTLEPVTERAPIADEIGTETIAAPMLQDLAGRLEQLDGEDRETAAQVVHTIVGAIHGLKLLESYGNAVPAELVGATVKELTAACRQLFEVAGYEVGEEEIQQFILYIARAELASKLTEQAEMAIDTDMHEHAQDLVAAVKYLSSHFHPSHLGRLVLNRSLAA